MRSAACARAAPFPAVGEDAGHALIRSEAVRIPRASSAVRVETAVVVRRVVVRLLPRREVQREVGLVEPVDEPADRNACVQDDVDEVRRRQVLHVLDAFLDEPGLVPDVHARRDR